MSELSHLDTRGRAHMVDVADKPLTRRVCVARGAVRMAPETLARISEGRIPKGDVLATARIAGIQAAKRTDQWIPLCHSLSLDAVDARSYRARARSSPCRKPPRPPPDRTGVEMEAPCCRKRGDLLTTVQGGDRGMVVDASNWAQDGGKSGDGRQDDPRSWARLSAGDERFARSNTREPPKIRGVRGGHARLSAER